jgi:outer membrane autotransporter protein
MHLESAAGQAQRFHSPAYAERDLSGLNGLALSCAERPITQARGEVGARFDSRHALDSGTVLILRARGAWVHDFSDDNSALASFQALPGFGFSVTGAAPARDAAQLSADSELRFAGGITLASKLGGELSSRGNSYGGTATLRYAW